jgi:hypothetical protein
LETPTTLCSRQGRICLIAVKLKIIKIRFKHYNNKGAVPLLRRHTNIKGSCCSIEKT